MTQADASPKEQLYQRVLELLGTRDVTPDDRIVIRGAFERADSWDDMPADIRSMIEKLEQLPRQAWDDPADVPDDLDSDTEKEGEEDGHEG